MAKLTAAGRKAIPTKSFALPGRRAYPIEDASHARNALARVSQHGSSSEKATVRAAVHRKYPGIGQQSGARGHADEAQDRKLIISLIKRHTGNMPVAGAQSGARNAGPSMHPRMHSLSKASANHLLNMGHIDTKLHSKIHKASAQGMASMTTPAFGAMAPPSMLQPPLPPAPAGMPPQQMGARRYKQPKYGAGHYMSTPTPVGADEGGGMGGGASAGARRKRW